MTRPDSLRLWLLGSTLLLVLSFVASARRGLPTATLPATPFDRTNPDLADQWRFLREAAQHLPPGVSYTVVAADRQTAMSLFMFSRALLPDRQARPTSYWDSPTPELGVTADYVLAYRSTPEPGLRVVGRLSSGVVAVRQAWLP
jgi:hypothetical protein